MKKKSFILMMQAVVVLCCSLVISGCDEIFATEDNPVTSYLQIYEKAVTLKVGDTYTRTAFAASDAIIEYSSSDVAVATVDQSGLVTAVGAGTALITVRATGYATDGRKIYIEDSKSYEVTVTGGGAAPSTNSYRVYTSGTDYTDESIPAGASAVETSAAAVTWPAGTYVVSSDASIGGNITLSGDVNLILCDGKELTVSGKIIGGTESLKIYGQASGTGKLTIDGGAGDYNIVVNDLQIHGGVFTGTNSGQAIETNNTLKIYHGTINVTADATGFMALGDLSIYGGTITASATNGYAVSVYNAAMDMTGGSLTATSSTSTGIGVTNNITIYGGTINATGGNNAGGNGGSGIVSNNGDITISGSANVTATGGDGGTYAINRGGHGIHAGGNGKSITISGGTVIATAGNGGGTGGYALFTSNNGSTGSINITGGNVTATAAGTSGIGINSHTIEVDGSSTTVNTTGAYHGMISDGTINFKAGTVNAISTDNNSKAIVSANIDYYGGTITATGGGPSGKGFDDDNTLSTLTNKSGAAVDFGRKTNSGDDWTAETVANNAAATLFDRYMILPKP